MVMGSLHWDCNSVRSREATPRTCEKKPIEAFPLLLQWGSQEPVQTSAEIRLSAVLANNGPLNHPLPSSLVPTKSFLPSSCPWQANHSLTPGNPEMQSKGGGP